MANDPTALTVGQSKIIDYLLNVDHPEGGPKARYFLSCGFSEANPQVFIEALFGHTSEDAFVGSKIGLSGTKFVFEGPLFTPSGKTP